MFVDVLCMTGLTMTDRLSIVQREQLVGQHIGETSKKTTDVIDAAKGGTLLVDEAYRLVPIETSRDFGPEAIDTIMAVIEGGPHTLTDRPAIILAGYPEVMERVLSVNPGLRRRITDQFNFPNYTIAEIVEIIFIMGKMDQFHLNTTTLELQQAITEHIPMDIIEGHNAGFSSRLLQVTKQQSNKRLSDKILADEQLSTKELLTLTHGDFKQALQILKIYFS